MLLLAFSRLVRNEEGDGKWCEWYTKWLETVLIEGFFANEEECLQRFYGDDKIMGAHHAQSVCAMSTHTYTYTHTQESATMFSINRSKTTNLDCSGWLRHDLSLCNFAACVFVSERILPSTLRYERPESNTCILIITWHSTILNCNLNRSFSMQLNSQRTHSTEYRWKSFHRTHIFYQLWPKCGAENEPKNKLYVYM